MNEVFLNDFTQNLRTGDILFFNEHPTNKYLKCLTSLIKCCTWSNYSHVGLVIVDPPWTSLKGIFVWESSYHGTIDPQDNKIKFGVQLTPIDLYTRRYPGNVQMFLRRPYHPDTYEKFSRYTLMSVQSKVYDAPYDTSIKDWIGAWLKVTPARRQTKSFFCSAFVAFILTECGILVPTTDWTKTTAADLSKSACDTLNWNFQYFEPVPVTNVQYTDDI